MEQVIRAYGRFLLEAAVFVLLLVILFVRLSDGSGNQGVFSMIGVYLDEVREAHAGTDFAGFAEESQVASPVISYLYSGILYTGDYAPETLVNATDAKGQSVRVRVSSIRDPRGNVQNAADAAGMTQLVFDQGGIYTLRVAAVDAYGRVSTCDVRIPVNWREETE